MKKLVSLLLLVLCCSSFLNVSVFADEASDKAAFVAYLKKNRTEAFTLGYMAKKPTSCSLSSVRVYTATWCGFCNEFKRLLYLYNMGLKLGGTPKDYEHELVLKNKDGTTTAIAVEFIDVDKLPENAKVERKGEGIPEIQYLNPENKIVLWGEGYMGLGDLIKNIEKLD